MTAPDSPGPNIGMFAPVREQCGVSDYTRLIVAGLRNTPRIKSVRVTPVPELAPSGDSLISRFVADERAYRAAARDLCAAPVDLVHVQHQYFQFGGLAPHRSHVAGFMSEIDRPLVLTVHEIELPETAAGFARRLAVRIVNRASFLHPAIKRLVVHTEQDREALVRLGVVPERIRVLRHPVPELVALPRAFQAKEALNLTGRRTVILAGFLSRKKGHALALRAMEHLPEDVVLLFAGGKHPEDRTGYVASLKGMIEAAGLQSRVRIMGYLAEEQLHMALAAADVAICPFPQTSGSGSMALLFAARKAVVASDILPHREIIADTPGAITLYPDGDERALAAATLALLDDPALREAAEAGARLYATRHTYASAAADLVNVYQAAMQPANGA